MDHDVPATASKHLISTTRLYDGNDAEHSFLAYLKNWAVGSGTSRLPRQLLQLVDICTLVECPNANHEERTGLREDTQQLVELRTWQTCPQRFHTNSLLKASRRIPGIILVKEMDTRYACEIYARDIYALNGHMYVQRWM